MNHHTFDANLEDDAAQEVHDGVAYSGCARAWRAAAPDDHGREQRHQLPVEEEGDQVAGKTDADGSRRINVCGR